MKKKLNIIKNDKQLSQMFLVLMTTFIAINAIFIYLLSGPLASANSHNLVLGFIVAVVEVAAVAMILRPFFQHDDEDVRDTATS
jgi:hypothetical protein